MKKRKNVALMIAINAIVAGLYVILTLPFGVFAMNDFIQFRPAEALTILPALMPFSIFGLVIGCAISNLIASPFGIADAVLGATVTLIAGLLTSIKPFKKVYLAPLPPIILNALCLPLIWMIAPDVVITYWMCFLGLLLTQTVVIYALGVPLYFLTQKQIMPRLFDDENN